MGRIARIVLALLLLASPAYGQESDPFPDGLIFTSLTVFDAYGILPLIEQQDEWGGFDAGTVADAREGRISALSDVYRSLGRILTGEPLSNDDRCEIVGEFAAHVRGLSFDSAFLASSLPDDSRFAGVDRTALVEASGLEPDLQQRVLREAAYDWLIDNPATGAETRNEAIIRQMVERTLAHDNTFLQELAWTCRLGQTDYSFNGYWNIPHDARGEFSDWAQMCANAPRARVTGRPLISRDAIELLGLLGVEGFSLDCVEADFAVTNRALSRIEISNTLLHGFNVYGSRAESLRIVDTTIDGNARMAEFSVTQDIVLRDVDVTGWTDSSRARIGGSFIIEGFSGGDPDGEWQAFYMSEVQVGGQISVNGMDARGGFVGERVKAKRIFVDGLDVAGNVVMTGARVDDDFIFGSNKGVSVDGYANLASLRADALSIWRVRVAGALRTASSTAGSYVQIHDSLIGELQAHDLSAPVIYMARSGVGSAGFDQASAATRIHMTDIWADRLDIRNADTRLLSINEAGGKLDGAALGALEDCRIGGDMARAGRMSLADFAAFRESVMPGLTGGCLVSLHLDGGMVNGNVSVGGPVLGALDVSAMQVGGTLDVAGDAVWYGEDACVIARRMSADTVIHRLGVTRESQNGARGPAYIDLYGAEYRQMLPGTSSIRSQRVSMDGMRMALSYLLAADGRQCVAGQGLVSGGEAVGYQPAIYDAVAAGYERTGELDLARMVRIIKNQDYAAMLDLGTSPVEATIAIFTKIIYGLADMVSGFGYDNLKAVLWLLLVSALGLIFLSMGEERFARMVRPLVWLVLAPVRWLKRAAKRRSGEDGSEEVPVAAHERRDGAGELSRLRLTRNGLAFTIDRSVPTLNLDQDFSRHAQLGLGQYLSGWFYLQRFISFIIVALMIAGAFNLFQ